MAQCLEIVLLRSIEHNTPRNNFVALYIANWSNTSGKDKKQFEEFIQNFCLINNISCERKNIIQGAFPFSNVEMNVMFDKT